MTPFRDPPRGRRLPRAVPWLLLALALVGLQVADTSCRKSKPTTPGGDGDGTGTGLGCSPVATWDGTIHLNEFTFDATYTLIIAGTTGSQFTGASFAGTGPSGGFTYSVNGSHTLMTFEFTLTGLPQVGFPYVGKVTGRFDSGCASFQGSFVGEDINGQPVTGSLTGFKRVST